MDIFWKKVALPQEEPRAGPSEGIPESSIFIRGDDCSVHVTASEDFLVGQDVEAEDSDIDDPDLVCVCVLVYNKII